MEEFMNKFIKITFSLLATVCVAVCAALFAACGDKNTPDPDNEQGGKTTYSITVTCDDTLVLSIIKVQLKSSDGKLAGESVLTTSGASATSGKAEFKLDSGSYTVNLEPTIKSDILNQYVFNMPEVTAANPSASVELKPIDSVDVTNTVTYTLTLLNPDGTPAADTHVQLCGGPSGSCYPGKTNAEGVAVFNLPAGVYEVHVPSIYIPSGYTFDDSAYKTGENGGEITVSFKNA